MDENLKNDEAQENSVQAEQPQGTQDANIVNDAPGGTGNEPPKRENKFFTKKAVPALILGAVAVFAIGFAGGGLANAVLDGHGGRMQYRMAAQAEEFQRRSENRGYQGADETQEEQQERETRDSREGTVKRGQRGTCGVQGQEDGAQQNDSENKTKNSDRGNSGRRTQDGGRSSIDWQS